jgi:hypothetical protein
MKAVVWLTFQAGKCSVAVVALLVLDASSLTLAGFVARVCLVLGAPPILFAVDNLDLVDVKGRSQSRRWEGPG